MPHLAPLTSHLAPRPAARPYNRDSGRDGVHTVSTNAYCGNNPVRLVDVDGREVINRYAKAYEYWKEKAMEAQERFDEFGGNKNAKGYKEARKDLNYTKRNCNRV